MEGEKSSLSSKSEKDESISFLIDQLLSKLGNPGRFQLFIFTLLSLNYFPVVFNQVVGAFYSADDGHYCDVTRGRTTFPVDGRNVTVVDKETGQCETLLSLEDGTNASVQCRHGDWMYHNEDRERTIVTEWDLVCDDAYLRPLSTTLYFCGVMLGGMLLGYLSDKFGRRIILLITLFVPVPFGVGIFFAPSYAWYVAARFVEGFFVQTLQMTSYIIAVELFLPQHRPIVGALLECMWGFSIIVLGGVAYIIRDWRYIQLAITLPRILALFYICVLPESLRWMIMNTKFEAAETLIKKISIFNNVEFPARSWQKIKSRDSHSEKSKHKGNFADLVRHKVVLKRSLILFYIWFAEAACYYGLTYKITSLAGNKYLNFFIGACVEMAAHLINIFLLKKINRRITFISYSVMAAVSCIVAGALPSVVTDSGIDLRMVSTTFAIVGRFSVAGLYSVIYLYTSELYPTVIRNIGMGMCGFWTRVGGVIAPQINSLGESGSFSVIVFGVMMALCSLLALMLPETNGRKLPDTIEDLIDTEPVDLTVNVDVESDSKHEKQEKVPLNGVPDKEKYIVKLDAEKREDDCLSV